MEAEKSVIIEKRSAKIPRTCYVGGEEQSNPEFVSPTTFSFDSRILIPTRVANYRRISLRVALMDNSMSNVENALDSEELDKFYRLMIEASQKVQEMKLNATGNAEINGAEDDNAPYVLPVVPYKEPLRKNPENVLHVMRRLHCMTTVEMQRELKKAHIDSRGKRRELYNRLKKYFRKEFAVIKNAEYLRNKTEKFYDYFVVIDFECTCEADLYDYNHEIIEFPAILVDVRKKEIVSTVDVFHSYVRPLANPQLSEFCSEFTGITQEMVDKALPFTDVLDSFRAWMQLHRLGQKDVRYAFVTDGPWDIAKFFQMQCIQSKLSAVPHDFRFYVNIRKSFVNKYYKRHSMQKTNLIGMLTFLNMKFEGREHSGLDDSKNIARIVIKMLEDRSELRVNEKLVKIKASEKGKALLTDISKEHRDRRAWRDNLPYIVQQITRDSFISGEYLDCDTCDEDD
uniref:Exonuclease domain-containing protein n=1 Tax=Elaeophora elaphi TaxID=1147741 RepID=A0A0R3S176_9BILA